MAKRGDVAPYTRSNIDRFTGREEVISASPDKINCLILCYTTVVCPCLSQRRYVMIITIKKALFATLGNDRVKIIM